LRQRQVDGFLYARTYHREVILPEVLHNLPVVIVDVTSPDSAISSVVPDELGGGRTAPRELIGHGHTKITFINNVDDMLDIDDPPQAIFCFNDRMAMGVYHAAHERGLRIPEDLSVVGFDNQPNIADGLFPNLPTVALPHYEMGTWGVRTLVEQLTRPADSGPSQVALACPLIHRESVGPPPGQGSHRVTARHATPRSTRPRGRTMPAAGLQSPDPVVPAGGHDGVPRWAPRRLREFRENVQIRR
jgi:LacI family transcriptional regulator